MALTNAQRLHSAALQVFRVDRGTLYPCLQTELDFHHLPSFPYPNTSPFVSSTDATHEVLWQNDSRRAVPSAEAASLDRLQKVIYAFNNVNPQYGPDLAIKAFLDLVSQPFWASTSPFPTPSRARNIHEEQGIYFCSPDMSYQFKPYLEDKYILTLER